MRYGLWLVGTVLATLLVADMAKACNKVQTVYVQQQVATYQVQQFAVPVQTTAAYVPVQQFAVQAYAAPVVQQQVFVKQRAFAAPAYGYGGGFAAQARFNGGFGRQRGFADGGGGFGLGGIVNRQNILAGVGAAGGAALFGPLGAAGGAVLGNIIAGGN